MQRKSSWTFLAFAFDSDTSQLSVFSEHGLAYGPRIEPFIVATNSFNNGGIRFGYSTKAGKGLRENDVVSCLSIYSKALDWDQAKQLQLACRILHGSPLPGTPKLPLTPIPSYAPAITTVPNNGQFPWLGIVIDNNDRYLCAASILDEFWVLTTSKCINLVNKKDGDLKVQVGVHDRHHPTDSTETHHVEKTISSGSTGRDIALIQLKTPIDFTSDYVNDAWLFDGDSSSIQLHLPQLVNGWGDNGRSPFVSETLPRYVPGVVLTHSQCSRAWNQSYDSNSDFCFLSSTTDKNVPCSGDEGSPLLYQGVADVNNGIGDHLVQVGLYYGRDEACSAANPGLFTDLSKFQGWISQQMACALPGTAFESSLCPM